MPAYQLLNTTDFVTTLEKEAIINFLLEHLETYSDSRDNVSRAIEYSLSKFPHQGGFVLMAREADAIIGVCVVNRTNFEGYFAENIMIYLAVDANYRKQGVATELLAKAKVYTKGSMMVRLQQNSSVRALFEKVGFDQETVEFVLNR